MSSEGASQDSSSEQRRRELIEAARQQVEKAQGPWGAGLHRRDAGATGSPIQGDASPPDDGSGGSSLPPPGSFAGYKLLREIHRGAQGVVYQAVQESMKRKVAIKVMKQGPFAGPADRARFDREVRLLGQLNHPNIVTIHGTGEAAGCHYFVMDYISGQPLDVHMASEERSIDETLRLFVKICDAVESAHLRGIIHRDLKPSNIRVDARGEPYILDFGLAKSASDSGSSMTTMTGRFLGTPAWASPEQAEGVPSNIDIRSDVYSLGVILFQMLTGKFPYKVTGSTHDVLDRIRKVEPLRPRELRRKINDEVETIVLKCLSKERKRRYQSAGELARDTQRYLAGEPIEAKRDSLVYVFGKQLRKYKPQATVAASFFLLLAVGFVVVLGYWRKADAAERAAVSDAERARIETRKAERLSAFLRGILVEADPMSKMTPDAPVREVFHAVAQRIGELGDEPEVQAEVKYLLGAVYRGWGEYEEAERYLNDALEMRMELFGPEHPDIAEIMTSLGILDEKNGHLDVAETRFRKALRIQRDKLGADHMNTVKTISALAALLIRTRRYEEAEPLLRESLAIRRRLAGEKNGASARAMLDLAVFLARTQRFDEAEEIYEEVVPLYRELYGEDHLRYAGVLNNRAKLHQRRGEYEAAVPLLRRSLEVRVKVLPEGHSRIALGRHNLASALYETGEYDEAEQLMRQGLAAYVESRGDDHEATAKCRRHLAEILLAKGQLAEAEELCRRALKVYEHPTKNSPLKVADSLRILGQIQLEERLLPSAEANLRRALELIRDSNKPAPEISAIVESALGACLTAQERYEEAEGLLTSACATLSGAGKGQRRDHAEALQRLIELHRLRGTLDEAKGYRRMLEKLQSAN